MLTGLLGDLRIEASVAERGFDYSCPKCRGELTLKKGRVVVHHFAHKPPTDCSWASGETQSHLAAKIVLRDAFRRMGYGADYEVEVLSSGGDRRADVLVTSHDGRNRVAIEIQHTPILYDAIERRTSAYIACGVPVMWLGILTDKMRNDAEIRNNGLVIRQYTIRPWEKWAHAFAFKELWYVDPAEHTLWKGSFSEHLIEVPSTSWYSSEGEEQYAGGYTRYSKRWRTLSLLGPYRIDDCRLMLNARKPWTSNAFSLPGGRYAHFVKD